MSDREKELRIEAARRRREREGIPETNLQKCRVAKGMSQADLAKRSGQKKRIIQSYESRERSIDKASFAMLCDLALALGVRFEDILESEELIEKARQIK